MSNVWGLPQETQDQIRQDLNNQLELAPREFLEAPVVDMPELSLRDLPEPPLESSQPPIIDLEGWDEHLLLTQEQRAMNMDEPALQPTSLEHALEEGRTWLRTNLPRQPSDPPIPHGRVVDEEEQQRPRVRRRIWRSVPPRVPPRVLPRLAPRPTPPTPPTSPSFVAAIAGAWVEPPRREAQACQSLSGVDHSLLNPPGCDPRHPSLPIYPPMPTRVPDRPGPLVDNPNLPWFGDLIHGQSHVLHQILWRGRITDDGPMYLFKLTFESDNFDGIWRPYAYACHLIYGGVGFLRWIYGQSRELPMNQRGAHVADMVQRTLRFLDIPDPFPGPPAQ